MDKNNDNKIISAKLIDVGGSNSIYDIKKCKIVLGDAVSPPEVIVDARSLFGYNIDIWSSGCILAEMLLGVELFGVVRQGGRGKQYHRDISILGKISRYIGPVFVEMLENGCNTKNYFDVSGNAPIYRLKPK